MKFFALLCVGLCSAVAYTAGQNPEVIIRPGSPTIQKSKGDTLALICEIIAPNPAQATFEWLNPQNNTIESKQRYNVQTLGNGLLLTVNNLESQDGGTFTCKAQYESKTLTKSVVVVPYLSITFVDANTEQRATLGTRYKIKCEVKSEPAPMVTWNRNDQSISNSEKYVLESDGLVIQNVQESDEGNYRCAVLIANIGEFREKIIHLEVISQPKILSNMSTAVEVIEGEPARIPCQALGKPKPSLSWIRTTDQKNMSTSLDGILYIEKITKEDNAIFKCVATNSAGLDERTVILSVLSKPEVIQIRNSTSVVGKTGFIMCAVYGNPTPEVFIRKYAGIREKRAVGSPLSHTSISTTDDKERMHVSVTTLTFNDVERYDDGLYECYARNKIGETQKNLHFGVEFKPTFQSTILRNVYTWNGRSANLTCVAESIPNATITWFFENKDITKDSYYQIYGTGPMSTLEVKPSNSRRVFGRYRCHATNTHGTDDVELVLTEAFAPQAISAVEFNDTRATTITFKFMEPMTSGGLPLKAYVVEYKKKIQDWSEAKNETWPVGSSYILTNLEPLAHYDFRFAAINEVGLGQWGGYASKQMPEISPPSEPVITNTLKDDSFALSDFARQIEVHWTIPANNGVEIDRYEIKYCVAQEDDEKMEVTDTCKVDEILNNDVSSSYRITDLSPNTLYKIELRAHNNIGYSQPSQRYFKTNMSSDQPTVAEGGGMSSAVIIYIVVAILIAFLVIVDIFCFFVGKMGVLYMLCGSCCGGKKKDDDKLGSESKDLISNGHNKKIDIEEQAPMITDGAMKDTTVEYDLKKGTAKTGFVGKDSAV